MGLGQWIVNICIVGVQGLFVQAASGSSRAKFTSRARTQVFQQGIVERSKVQTRTSVVGAAGNSELIIITNCRRVQGQHEVRYDVKADTGMTKAAWYTGCQGPGRTFTLAPKSERGTAGAAGALPWR